LRTVRSWKFSHAVPAAIRSLETEFSVTSQTRAVERMDEPSQSMERIWTRLSKGSLFMTSKMIYLNTIVKHKVHFDSI
jgi:hypothetical protein